VPQQRPERLVRNPRRDNGASMPVEFGAATGPRRCSRQRPFRSWVAGNSAALPCTIQGGVTECGPPGSTQGQRAPLPFRGSAVPKTQALVGHSQNPLAQTLRRDLFSLDTGRLLKEAKVRCVTAWPRRFPVTDSDSTSLLSASRSLPYGAVKRVMAWKQNASS
jgi:hypothetical protein